MGRVEVAIIRQGAQHNIENWTSFRRGLVAGGAHGLLPLDLSHSKWYLILCPHHHGHFFKTSKSIIVRSFAHEGIAFVKTSLIAVSHGEDKNCMEGMEWVVK
jgi:hypothetical protein